MSSNNHATNRAVQQDARAWAELTGIKYTEARRQIENSLAQGFLGPRLSARHLIKVLNEHHLIGTDRDNHVLGEDGFCSEKPWNFNQESDYVELALIADFLRIFAPLPRGTPLEVSSYTLKHTAEKYLGRHCSYVSNGRLIWAAAALGLDMVGPKSGSLNLLIGVSEREHDYVRRMVDPGRTTPHAHHYRPQGFTQLQTALGRSSTILPDVFEEAASRYETNPFHNWLITQANRDDRVGDVATEYSAGVWESSHPLAKNPEDLVSILNEVDASFEVYKAAEAAILEWKTSLPSASNWVSDGAESGRNESARIESLGQTTDQGIRTELISEVVSEVGGFGGGSGDIERFEYECPCGDGRIIEEHDNIPGFRDHHLGIYCDKCKLEWKFVDGRAKRQWRIEHVNNV